MYQKSCQESKFEYTQNFLMGNRLEFFITMIRLDSGIFLILGFLANFEFVLKLKLYSISRLPNDHLIGIWGDFEVIWNQKKQSDIVSNCRFAFRENKTFSKMWVAWLSLYFAKFKRIQEVCWDYFLKKTSVT